MGILFSGSDISTLSGAVNSIGAIFFLVFVLVIPMQAAVVPLIEDRAVLYRETVSGTYSRLSYGLGQLAADLPFHLLNTILMFIFFYFLVDFQRKAEEMGYFLLMLFLSNWVIQSLGQLFALATPNEESANGLAGLSIILSVILMGFLITVNAMPAGWTWGTCFVFS
jgi:ABC-type multidrug transport system permease subunit